MTVSGLSNYKVLRYDVNVDKLSADITLFFPKISDTGAYDGLVGPLGVNFVGEFDSYYHNTKAFIHFEAQRVWRDGEEYLQIIDVKLSSDKKFRALKSSHPTHDVAIPILYPYIEATYADIIKEEMNKMVTLIPYDMLLPPQ
jgi:hypothetical protein